MIAEDELDVLVVLDTDEEAAEGRPDSAQQKKQIKDALPTSKSKKRSRTTRHERSPTRYRDSEPQQETLDAAGFRWPGVPIAAADGPNPSPPAMPRID